MFEKLKIMPKKKLAIVYVVLLAVEFVAAALSFVFVPWIGPILVALGNATLLAGGYLLIRKYHP